MLHPLYSVTNKEECGEHLSNSNSVNTKITVDPRIITELLSDHSTSVYAICECRTVQEVCLQLI